MANMCEVRGAKERRPSMCADGRVASASVCCGTGGRPSAKCERVDHISNIHAENEIKDLMRSQNRPST